jgi:MFS family permease
MISDSPWQHRAFRTVFTASALSQLGTNVGYVAVPLVAVTALDASAGELGALAALTTAAFLLIGLPAGAWVDRMRQGRVLVVSDLVRALLFASVPVAWWMTRLTLEQLFLVVLLNGVATVFFDVSGQTVLPQVVGRGGLVRANAAMVGLYALGNIAGKGAGGGLVELVAAPTALVLVSLSYLASALALLRVRRLPAPARTTSAGGLQSQIAAGVRHVVAHRELRALALTGGLTNLGSQVVNTVLPIVFVRELGLTPGVLGLFWAAGGLGLLIGAVVARRLATVLGFGRALGMAGLCLAPAGLLVPLVDDGPRLWLAGCGWLLAMLKTGIDNVLGVSLRQRLTPDAMLGRMNATFRFVLTGALAVGAVVAGVSGEAVGVRGTLWLGGALLTVAFLPVFVSPVRRISRLPEPSASPASQVRT